MSEITVKSLSDNVQGRVRSVIMDALPDDMINRLIESEMESMLKAKDRGYREEKLSDIQLMIRNAITNDLHAKIKLYITEHVTPQYDSDRVQNILSEELTKAVSQVGIQAIASNIVMQAFNVLRQNVR